MNDLTVLGAIVLGYVGLRLVLGLCVHVAKKRLRSSYDIVEPLVTPLHLTIIASSFHFTFRFFERSTRLTYAFLALALAWVAIRFAVLLVCDVYFRLVKGVVVPSVLKRILAGVLYVAVLFAVLHLRSGVAIGDLLVIAGIALLVMGIALQSVLGSFFVGLSISLQNKFKVGELVRFGDVEGHVVEVDWKSTQIRTRENNLVTAPNRLLSESLLTNYHRLDKKHRVTVRIPALASAPPNRVKALLLEAAAIAEGVLEDPPPAATLDSYADGAIEYGVSFWVSDYESGSAIEDRVRTLAWYRLQREALLPLPDAERDKTRAPVSSYLEQVPFFSVVDAKQLARLDELATVELYGRGEPVFRQGDEGDCLYVVKSGSIAITVEGKHSTRAVIGSGGFFGERSLLTGEKRSAKATAAEDAKLIVIRKSQLLELFNADPEAAERISTVMIEREQANQLDLTVAQLEQQKSSFFGKVKKFFQL